ncbi:MAG TPA: competence/damage-inducible protein A, partial [Chthoniobacteraceae bacterium]|nr:competence/damage-inducible protein A [Chthoniobacteraceae bacterium]
MRVIVINTGTEILLGDVINTHLSFIAREILPLGLRVERQISVPDGPAIRDALQENLGSADLIFVTGGLGPTTDDLTREVTSELLGRELAPDPDLAHTITHRLFHRRVRMTDRILRQAEVPRGAVVLPNDNGTAPGLYLAAEAGTPHLFLLPGPPRELQPMFGQSVMPILRQIVKLKQTLAYRSYRIVG